MNSSDGQPTYEDLALRVEDLQRQLAASHEREDRFINEIEGWTSYRDELERENLELKRVLPRNLRAALQNGHAAEARYELRWSRDAMKPKEPIKWIVENLFSEGSLNVLMGDPGSKKTWLSMDLCVAVAAGVRWLGRETTQGPALIIDEESGLRRLERRLEGILRARHAPIDTPLAYVSLAQFDARKPEDVAALRQLIEKVGATLVVIDALADIMPGGDENAVSDVQPVFMALRKIAEETRAAIVVIHHTNKAGGYRGSTAIPGGVDLMLKVESKADSPNLDITSEKVRDVEPFTMAAFIRFEDEPFKVFISPSDRPEEPAKLPAGEEYVLRYLREHGAATMKDIMDHADTCTDKTARVSVYSLAKRGVVERVDKGGPGETATYDLVRKKPAAVWQPVNDDDDDEAVF